MSMTVEIDNQKAVINRLDSAIKAVGSPQKPLESIGDFLVSEFKLNFANEGSQLGSRWAALAESTRLQKIAMGYAGKGILERTGRLKNAFEKTVSAFQVRVANPTSYFRYHQLGEGNNPKRTMIARSNSISGQIFQIISQFVRDSLSK